MEIMKARLENLEVVTKITHDTIKEVFPHYYTPGAIEVFLKHHSAEEIRQDITDGLVYLLHDGDENVGTITVRGNEIDRLFIYPKCQGKGYGTTLLEFAEKQIAGQGYGNIMLGSTLCAKHIYKKHGYVETEYYIFQAENGDCLCFDMMSKGCKYTLSERTGHMAKI